MTHSFPFCHIPALEGQLLYSPLHDQQHVYTNIRDEVNNTLEAERLNYLPSTLH
jgi:hypothetical protein